MTFLEAIQKGSALLARSEVESPRQQSELLLAHVLKLPRMRLYLDFDRKLQDAQFSEFTRLVENRAGRVPLQHLMGSASFCGHEMAVTPETLIPRPETEVLAEEAWLFLDAMEGATAFADLGTGSGCIAIAIAAAAKRSRGVAVDISAGALMVAEKNIRQNQVADRIELRAGDFLSALQPAERFEAIVSNPPYIPRPEIELLQPEVRDHDPRLALDGGADGLDFYRALAEKGGQFLQPHGRLLVEFGDGQSEAIANLFVQHGWKIHKIAADLSQRPRVLTVTGPPMSSRRP